MTTGATHSLQGGTLCPGVQGTVVCHTKCGSSAGLTVNLDDEPEVTPVGDLDFTTWSLLFDALWLPDPKKKKKRKENLTNVI